MSKRQYFWIVVLILIEASLIIAVSIISRTGLSLTIGDVVLTSTHLAGIISASKAIILTCILVLAKKKGLIIDIVLWCGEMFFMIMGMVKARNFNSITGLVQNIVSLIVLFIVYQFIKKEKINSDYLSKLSRIDSLTDLYNRRAIITEINGNMKHGIEFYCAFITITNFKEINDYSGHDYGDKMLFKFAERIRGMAKDSEFIGRIGGAEFLIIIKSERNDSFVERRIKEYMKCLSEPYIIGKTESTLVCRAGIVKYPEDGDDESTLFRHMDATIAYNRGIRENEVSFFNKTIIDDISESVKIEDRLIKALAENLIHLVYQPQFHTGTRRLRGFETLSRLEDEEGNPIRPDKFITIAEKTNLIFEVDNYVLEKAISTFKPLIDRYPDLVISVNISARHFTQSDFPEYVNKLLMRHAFPAKSLEIEITETAFAESITKVKDCMDRLHGISVQIALDDFGTGYASLAYLSQLPVNLLKIDKSFIDKLNTSEMENDFVKVIIDMGHTLNLDVISEGVETEEQKKTLENLGCNLIQGFIWGKPLELEDAIALIEADAGTK